jgi:adenylate kinase family enzyme
VSSPRINIRGSSCSGKTTLAAELAAGLRVAHIELDALHHGPNWAQPTRDEFRARVQAAMAAAPGGWVIDGNYDSKLDSLVTGAADTVVWLDPPLPLIMGRMFRRTLSRIRGNVELWNGNHETWRNAVWSRDALVWYTCRSFFRHRREWPARGYVRLRTPRAARLWLEHTLAGRQVPP